MFAREVSRRPIAGGLTSLALVAWALVACAGPVVAQEHGTAEAPADAHSDAAHDTAHEDAAHGAHGGAHGGHAAANTSPVEFDPDLAIYTLVVFVILFFILTKFAWKPIAEGLDRREHLIAEQIAAAERSQVEARRLLENYEQKLAAAQDEVRGILDEARRDAATTGQEIVAKAASEAEAEKNRALREIDTAKVQAVKELAEQSARLAVSLAGKIVSSELDQNRHSQLIADAMSRFPAGNGDRN
ncbi:MAG: F0F1 ATP synthase subunit B [Pirellulales bacterium]